MTGTTVETTRAHEDEGIAGAVVHENAYDKVALDSVALIASFEQPATMLAKLGSILFVTTIDYEVRVWNARTVEVLELHASEVVGLRLGDCAISWDWAKVRSVIEAADTDPIRLDDVPFKSASGRTGILAFTVTILRSRECRPIGLVWFGAEVSERRRQQLNEIKSHKLAAIGRLAAELAHEMNSPLQYISDNLHFLRTSVATMNRCIARELARGVEAQDADELSFLTAEVPDVIEQSLGGLAHLARVARTLSALVPTRTPMQEAKIPVRELLMEVIERIRREGSSVIPITVDFSQLPSDKDLVHSLLLAEVFRCSLLAVIEAASVKLGGPISKDTTVAVDGKCVLNELIICVLVRDSVSNDTDLTSAPPSERVTAETDNEIGYGLAVAKAVLNERLGGRLSVATPVGEILRVTLTLPT